MSTPSVIVVGGGLVGLATAHELLRARPDAAVTVLEKEPGVGRHQSAHSSGVLHAGLSYAPGSLKGRLAVTGIRRMIDFCQEHEIPYEQCGKLVVAASEDEVPRLTQLLDRGRRNGLAGLRWLEPAQMRELEPNVSGVAAVHVPEEGIVDFPRVADAMANEVMAKGGRVITRARVDSLARTSASPTAGWMALTPAGAFEADVVVTCAGLQADRVARMAGEQPELSIVPFRGDYYSLRDDCTLVRNLVYPVPDPAFPFLGLHFTRLIRGGIAVGPSAVLALAREGYRKSALVLRDLMELVAFPGLWQFVRRYPAMCWAELRRSFSRELFCSALR
ncbi:MAG TPA: L-2-hydroxyglutarate oxidase, partial [Gemmatimonadaceae bacterium]|nr:L-2-hydroxyglutarate oxidase [Gemmatimonadaceae bacterium]